MTLPAQRTEPARVPPHNLDAEESLLGAMLLSGDAAAVAIEKCAAVDFYKPTHGHIFAAIRALVDRDKPVDVTIVGDELQRCGLLGDPSVLIRLQAEVPSIAHVRHYATIVADHARRREQIQNARDLIEAAYAGDLGAAESATSRLRVAEPTTVVSRLRRWSMAELAEESDDFEWLVSGLLARPTYGQLAGEMKTLKTYLTSFISVGLASGKPIFNTFMPAKALPVLAYVGEGGRALWKRRTRRICSAMGVEWTDLDLHPVFDVAPIASPIFQDTLQADLVEIEPGLTTVDPWYAYHGAATKASDLHQEGALLNQLSTPCMDGGSSLLINNHMNQTGSGMSLKRITMAGSGEWADTWVLLEHREDPDVAAGSFKLTLEIGSRQWGGTTWELDLEIGRFDETTCTHDGEITWELRRAESRGSSAADKPSDRTKRAKTLICEALADCPWTMTKTELKKLVGGDRKVFDAAIGDLVDNHVIAHDMVGRIEAGITKNRPLWGLTPTRADPERPDWVRESE